MKAHIIPETYLSSWKNNIGSNSIYVFDSVNYSYNSKNLNSLSNTYFQQKDEYILKLEDCTTKIYQDLFDDIYSTLRKKYVIKYKNAIISSGYRLRNYCRSLDNKSDWEIINIGDGQRYKFNKFKDELKNEWKDKYNDAIEKFFCDNYENNWSVFTEYLIEKTQSNQGLLDLDNYEEYFLEFVSLILTRQYTNFDGYKKIISSLVNKYKIADNLTEENIKKIWLSQFFEFKMFKEHQSNECKSNFISLMINNLRSKEITLEFLISKNTCFFTSDNPIFRIEDKGKMTIYFPITKEICLAILPKKRKYENLYKYYEATSNETKKINKLIVENSKKNFICTQKNFEECCNL